MTADAAISIMACRSPSFSALFPKQEEVDSLDYGTLGRSGNGITENPVKEMRRLDGDRELACSQLCLFKEMVIASVPVKRNMA